MTRITKMQMLGFKSFAKKTELLFGENFNCILGPNGSGKSNVGDALCFVLGRSSAKAMRAEKSANLIYNGGKKKEPAKFGEVSIYFDNSKKIFPEDTNEVKVSRKIKQNGSSVYRINDNKVTRTQVLDMLNLAKIDPDGFNLILQGDIVRFVEMPSVERRQIVEEISGISGYEEKKRKATNELAKVDEKLNEADIVLTERRTYLRELRKDRDQALKFKELKENIDVNKASYLSLQIKDKEKVSADIEKKVGEHKSVLDKSEAKIKEFKSHIEAKKQEIDTISKEIEIKGEKEQVSLHKQVENLKVELATDKTRIENCRTEIERINEREKQLNKEHKESGEKVNDILEEKKALEKQKVEKEKELKIIEEQIAKFKKKNDMDNVTEIEKDIEDIDKEAEDKQNSIAELRERQQNFLREKDRLEIQISNMDEKINKVLEVEKEHKSQVTELKNKKELFKKATLELNKRLNEDSEISGNLGSARKRLMASEEKLAKLEARNMAARENVAAEQSIRKVLELKKKIPGIYGTVSELGNVSSKYSTALEVAAGNKIKFVVVEDDKVAAQCIKFLKERKLGIAAFIPMNKIKAKTGDVPKNLQSAKGCHGLAIDLIDFEPKFKKVFTYVFGGTLVVDNIDVARRLGIGSAKMVTLDGDLADQSGVMKGGYRLRKGKGLGFKENEVVKDIEQCNDTINDASTLIKSLESRRHENEELIVKLRKEKAELEAEIITLEKTLHLDSGDMGASQKQKKDMQEMLEKTDKELDSIIEQISEVNRALAQNKIKRQGLREKISQLRNPRLVAEFNAFEEKKTQVKERIIQIDSELKNFDTQVKMISPESEKITEVLKQISKEKDKFNIEIKALAEKIKKFESELKDKEKKSAQFYAKYKAMFNQRSKINDEINKIDRSIEKIRDTSRSAEIKMNTYSLELAKFKAELAGLYQEFKQYEGVKLNLKKDVQVLKQEIDKFERMMSNLGAVNMRALEVYSEIEKEYNALVEKKETLMKEKEDVEALIMEIETKKTELFMRTLNAVGEKFENIFVTLSRKGTAYLELENPKNPFEGGLSIKVKISGKKYLDIRSLSGGEKTLTALAFIFAIQEHEPHSFYVLDEVDAALDKHNSEKLAKLIRKYCDYAQYIVVSHNDAMISEADNLYGVSMNEHGISQVTSLKI
ncbi:chromosome segregation protein SMC [Candidatus Woesearchaeota archaeon]|nr:chromosome segregation protein SMC [Candidatus Woesearchaeota archaeon]